MAEITAAGAKLYISNSAESGANSQSAYEALSYIEVGKLVDIPEFGISYQSVTTDQLGERFTKMFKGQKTGGSPVIVVDHDRSDSGQAAINAAAASDDEYAFKVTLNNAGSGSPSRPETFYFRARVMSNPITIGTANNMVRRSFQLGINSDLIEVAAI